MNVEDAMNRQVLTITPDRTLRDAACEMAGRNCGSAVVVDPEQPGPGIVTERDLLRSIAEGGDPDRELVRDHLSTEGRFAERGWHLERAAEAMLSGGTRHLVVVEEGEPVGVMSMRDIVRHTGAD